MISESAAAPIILSKLLIVEGKDDLFFFEALLVFIGLSRAIEIRESSGKNNYLTMLKTVESIGGFDSVECLALTRDADDDFRASFDSACGHLKTVGLAPPKAHGSYQSGSPATGIFILPDGKSAGALEDLCLIAV